MGGIKSSQIPKEALLCMCTFSSAVQPECSGVFFPSACLEVWIEQAHLPLQQLDLRLGNCMFNLELQTKAETS